MMAGGLRIASGRGIAMRGEGSPRDARPLRQVPESALLSWSPQAPCAEVLVNPAPATHPAPTRIAHRPERALLGGSAQAARSQARTLKGGQRHELRGSCQTRQQEPIQALLHRAREKLAQRPVVIHIGTSHGRQIGVTRSVPDDGGRVATAYQEEVEKQPTDSPVPIAKWVDPLEVVV